jgi:hypothetical protein
LVAGLRLPVAGNLEREISANAYNRISSDIPDTKPETNNRYKTGNLACYASVL